MSLKYFIEVVVTQRSWKFKAEIIYDHRQNNESLKLSDIAVPNVPIKLR